jgi:hypothetical protein
MNVSNRLFLSVCGLMVVAALPAARAQQVSQLIWQVGVEDSGQSEFSQEQNSNDPPAAQRSRTMISISPGLTRTQSGW